MQNRFSSAHQLLDSEGRLIEAGWADTALLDYKSRSIKYNRMNMREWDRYIIISGSGEYALSMWISDKWSVGAVSACFYDIKNKNQYDCFHSLVLPAARICMSDSVESGSVVYKNTFCDYMCLVNESDRHLYCKYSGIYNNELEANIHIGYSKTENTLAVAAPCSQNAPEFCYNAKKICLPVSGYVTVNSEKYEFNSETDFAVLDWGRGVWNAQDVKRFVCVGCGDADGKKIGFNIGYGLGDMSAASENAVFINGVCHKIGKVFIDIPFDDRSEKWTVRSDDNRFEVEIMPVYNCVSKHTLGLKSFSEKVMFGRMSGRVVLDDGENVTINNMLCFFEESKNKY